MADPAGASNPTRGRWSPWRAVVMFGATSLAADLVYEGARSLYGPLLASLGASAVVVGGVTGAGESAALVLRLVFGPWTDRTGAYWPMTIAGYLLTLASVPLMAVTPFLGGAGLVVAAALILLERTGKAVRSPAKTALLAHLTAAVGRGRGFGVHKAMDQTGAFLGPLIVAGVIAVTGALWAGLAVLVVPSVLAVAVLLLTRAAIPDPSVYDRPATAEPPAELPAEPPAQLPAEPSAQPATSIARSWWAAVAGIGLPRSFFWYAAAAAAMTGGLVTFGLIGYHLVVSGLAADWSVPVLYSGGMLAEAVAAIIVGWLYDRVGARVLYAVPVLVALVPGLAMAGRLAVAVAGVIVWGLAFGLTDSTVKALVADLVEPARRATAYGVFAAGQGVAATLGGLLAGWLYEWSVTALVVFVAATQLVAAALLARALHWLPSGADRSGRPAR